MAKITRIKASDGPSKEEGDKIATITRKKIVVKDKKTEKEKRKEAKRAKNEIGNKSKDDKKPFILIRPFVYLGRYLKDSWRELRQVRWPNRKTTWKMVIAVLIYTVLFVIFISVLDIFFTWLFNLIFGN